MTLQELAQEHDYYCSDSNFYSNESKQRFSDFHSFWREWNDADIDLNLMFRWDVKHIEEEARYSLYMYLILQRKGIFFPIEVENFEQKDVPVFVEWAKKHAEKLRQIWQPIKL